MWGIGALIPGFPRPHPEISGTGWGRGWSLEKFWGFFGDGVNHKIGFFGDKTPNFPKKFLDFFGVGDNLNFWGFSGFLPQKTQILGIPRKSPFWWILSLVPYIWVLHQLGRACNHSSSVMLLLQGCKECIWTTRFLRKPHLHQSILWQTQPKFRGLLGFPPKIPKSLGTGEGFPKLLGKVWGQGQS